MAPSPALRSTVALLATTFAVAGTSAADSASPFVQRLADSVRIQTISHQDPAQFDREPFEEFLSFLRKNYPATFRTLSIEHVNEFSLLMIWRGRDEALEPVLFEGHYDVVPIEPGTEQDWTFPPFSGALANGYLWGRGSVDDKGAVIGLFETIETLIGEGFAPARTLYFSIGHDEEIGGHEGSGRIAQLLEERGVRLAYMIGEGGGMMVGHPLLPDRLLAMIALAEKTFVTLTLTARGEGGHSSIPPDDNSLVKLAKAVAEVHDHPFSPQIVHPVDAMFSTIGQEVDGFTGWLLRNQGLSAGMLARQMAQDRMGAPFVRTTTAVTIFEAGIKENVVPQTAEAKINFRLLPGTTMEEVVERVREIVDNPEIDIHAEQWGDNPPVARMDGEGYRRISEAVEAAIPDALVVPGIIVGTTDTRHFAGLTRDLYRFHPTFWLQMDDGVGVHGTDEKILIEGLERVPALYRELMTRVAAR